MTVREQLNTLTAEELEAVVAMVWEARGWQAERKGNGDRGVDLGRGDSGEVLCEAVPHGQKPQEVWGGNAGHEADRYRRKAYAEPEQSRTSDHCHGIPARQRVTDGRLYPVIETGGVGIDPMSDRPVQLGDAPVSVGLLV